MMCRKVYLPLTVHSIYIHNMYKSHFGGLFIIFLKMLHEYIFLDIWNIYVSEVSFRWWERDLYVFMYI